MNKEVTWDRCNIAIEGIQEKIKKTERVIANIQADKNSGAVIRSARQKKEKEKVISYRIAIELLSIEQGKIIPF